MNAYLLTQHIDEINNQECIDYLERGKILFFPEYFFSDVPELFLSESILDGSRKNISYDSQKKTLSAFKKNKQGLEEELRKMMQAYADFSFQLLVKTLPSYSTHLCWGRTSFRPAQIKGRTTSKRKDDTRLHVDSFAASPVNGLRILRVFCNVNPNNEPRVWNLGEPFPQVLERFACKINTYNKLKSHALKWIRATKTFRTPYDHYMLELHDKMKLDDEYQSNVQKTQVDFPSQSTWIVFTDHVSHAALSGQHLLEQTSYLPVEKMAFPEHSPLKQWQKIKPEFHVF
ncbi:MAG: Kdo hydroxylase family protein [Legionella sp.]|nr:Kdo hydroxylase family protein [Legionella sp.]